MNRQRSSIPPLLLGLALLLTVPAIALAQNGTDNPWPIELTGERGSVTVYQPQLETFTGDTIESRAAVAVKLTDAEQPLFGAVWFEARALTDTDERIVTFDALKVTAAKFPDLEDDQVQALTDFLEAELPQWDIVIDLDRLLAELDRIEARSEAATGIKNDPPEVIYRDHPAVLVMIDGDPILANMDGVDLKYVANSAYYILQDPGSKNYYLKGGKYWFESREIKGSWSVANNLPKDVNEVAKQIAEEEKKAIEEAKAAGDSIPNPDEEVGDSEPPEIIVRTQPAELIVTDGEPNLAPINETELLYVTNCESDIVFELQSQSYYLLISGRWFQSKSLDSGEWTYISQEDLPEEFANIPLDSDMSQVRTSVAGTQEAKEAVLANSVPQTAEIDRKTATVTVTYDGDPEFEKCSDNVAYARNTDKSVILIDGTYYCCDDGVWFVSSGPEGPWSVADAIPEEVQEIPAECPVSNVKYVYIYDSTPDVVYVGYTPGYYGSYVYGGVVVYGTGWYYHPWYRAYYYPRPVTYGFGVHYNPWTGWGFSFGVSYGWLHIRWGRPWYGGWWGVGGYHRGYRHGYHRGYRHGYHRGARAGFRAGYRAGQRNSTRNAYRARNNGVNRTGGRANTAQARPSTRQSAGAAQRPSTSQQRPSTGTSQKKQPKASSKPNNVYSDKSGNVYRNQNNQWQKKDKGGWSSSQGSQNLNKSQSSRNRGSQRSSASRSRGGGGGGRRR